MDFICIEFWRKIEKRQKSREKEKNLQRLTNQMAVFVENYLFISKNFCPFNFYHELIINEIQL